ncbi:MAG: malate synthase G [Gammaproteobacteria bacterium]|nr:malate synthase G [Gammaproteobacteria bacterium]
MPAAAPSDYENIGNLKVATVFKAFVEAELLPDLNIDATEFWRGLERIFGDLLSENQRLLEQRAALQLQLDAWHGEHAGKKWSAENYRTFLQSIGYLHPEAGPFAIDPRNVDTEIASVAGPQLVVPVSNARFALNAANARWGSLYDALYGSNVIPETRGRERAGGYNPVRGQSVIEYAALFLDRAAPLVTRSHKDVRLYKLAQHDNRTTLEALFEDGAEIGLQNPYQFAGHHTSDQRLGVLLKNNGLHFELVIDPDHPIGKGAAAHVADVMMEAAITTIQDCEDSVAAVDAEDKVGVYRNWLGLMRGTLSARFSKNGKELERTLHHDQEYRCPDGRTLVIPGRSLMLVRNVGHLMTNSAVLDQNGNEIPEGILDAVITTTCALYDLRRKSSVVNSRTGSVYIVKPKMHGPDEAAFTDTLFARVEDLLGLARNTLKIGVMDEERRTTVNLKECIRAVKDRLVFINTGFLDRTGDEIHSCMEAGIMLPKDEIKKQVWIDAYERWNVDIGIECGLPGKAQIGKGMWPKPDELKEMMDTKQQHPEAGANCAWVPSPTAATLHALHYHDVDVLAVQEKLAARKRASLDEILTIPVADRQLTAAEVVQELRNSCQTILGYVVRWIDQGVGCSKVPDINDVGLMEDRATLRISSQLLANWLHHELCDGEQIIDVMKEMAVVVDRQNADDPNYQPMSDDFEHNVAFAAACDLVLRGCEQPNGYTEPLLHERRMQKKAQSATG